MDELATELVDQGRAEKARVGSLGGMLRARLRPRMRSVSSELVAE